MDLYTRLVDPTGLRSRAFDPVADPDYEVDEHAAEVSRRPYSVSELGLPPAASDPAAGRDARTAEARAPALLVAADGVAAALPLPQVIDASRVPDERAFNYAVALLDATRPRRVALLRTLDPRQAPCSGQRGADRARLYALPNEVYDDEEEDDNEGSDAESSDAVVVDYSVVQSGVAAAILAECEYRKIPARVLMAVEDEDGPSLDALRVLASAVAASSALEANKAAAANKLAAMRASRASVFT